MTIYPGCWLSGGEEWVEKSDKKTSYFRKILNIFKESKGVLN